MDPNAALMSILCGHTPFEHAEALEDWLFSGGFEPEHVLMPADKHEFFATHCTRQHADAKAIGVMVKANKRGIWTQSPGDRKRSDWWLAATWDQIRKLEDSEY